jgi:hypothetical protein
MQLIKRLKNLIRWFPIIWKDSDYDYRFIFEILKTKLKHQAEYIGKHGSHLSAERDAEKMMLCVRLIQRVQDEYYQAEFMDYHESEYVWTDIGHEGYELDIVEKSERFDEYFKKYPRIYKQVLSAEKASFQRDSKRGIAINMAHINQDRAHKLLFKVLERNILHWWD